VRALGTSAAGLLLAVLLQAWLAPASPAVLLASSSSELAESVSRTCQQRVSIDLSRDSVVGGETLRARITLACPAAVDRRVRLSGFRAVVLPRAVTVEAGKRTARVRVSSSPGSTVRQGRVTAQVGKHRDRARLVVRPTPPPQPPGTDGTPTPTGPACDPEVADLSLPVHVHAGDPATGTVTLTCAPAAPTPVWLAASGGNEVRVPSQVTVPAGQKSTSFRIDLDAAYGPRQVVTVQATVESGVLHHGTFVMDPGLAYFEIEASDFDTLDLGLAISGPAPPGGLTVTLSSTSPELVGVPQSYFFPAGSRGGRLDGVTTTPPADDAEVTVSASLSHTTMHVTDVRIGQSSSVGGISMSFDGDPDELFGGGVGHENFWVSTERPAPRGGAEITFTVDSDVPALELEPVWFHEGTRWAILDLETLEVTRPTQVTITATSQGHTGTLTLTVRPRMIGLELPESAEAGTWWEGKVVMAGPSDLPLTVHLHTGWSVMEVTRSVTVPPGATEAVFVGRSGQVPTSTRIKVYAYVNDYHQLMDDVLITPSPA
jgi:hypothetical protein